MVYQNWIFRRDGRSVYLKKGSANKLLLIYGFGEKIQTDQEVFQNVNFPGL